MKSLSASIEKSFQSLQNLLNFEYGQQNRIGQPALQIEWYKTYKDLLKNKNISAAVIILEKAIQEDPNNGLPFLKYGELLIQEGEYDKALQSFLTGANKCELLKTTNLMNAAELLFISMNDFINSLTLIIKSILSISKCTIGFGIAFQANPKKLNIDQEKAIQFLKLFLKCLNYDKYFNRLNNILLATKLNDDYVHKCTAIIHGNSNKEITNKIRFIIENQIQKVLDQLDFLQPSHAHIKYKTIFIYVQGDLDVLKAFCEELDKIGFTFNDRFNPDCNPKAPNRSADLNCLYITNSNMPGLYFGRHYVGQIYSNYDYTLPKDWDNLLQLLIEEE